MDLDAPGSRARYELSLVPDWGDIERVRVSVGLCADVVGRNGELRHAVTLATCELLENAIRHSPVGALIDYSLAVENGRATVRVGNPCAPGSEDGERLESVIRWIAGFSDPRLAYIERLRQIVAAREGKKGGLGLVRVAYEGGCRLSCSLAPEQARVTVEAQFVISPQPRALTELAPVVGAAQVPAR